MPNRPVLNQSGPEAAAAFPTKAHSLALLGAVPAAVVLLAAVAKLADWYEAVISLNSWSLFPPSVAIVLFCAIVVGELVFGVLWFLPEWRHVATWGLLGLLLTVTTVYGMHLAAGLDPECRCFGKIMQWAQWKETAGGVLIRNAVLIVLTAVSHVSLRHKAQVPDATV